MLNRWVSVLRLLICVVATSAGAAKIDLTCADRLGEDALRLAERLPTLTRLNIYDDDRRVRGEIVSLFAQIFNAEIRESALVKRFDTQRHPHLELVAQANGRGGHPDLRVTRIMNSRTVAAIVSERRYGVRVQREVFVRNLTALAEVRRATMAAFGWADPWVLRSTPVSEAMTFDRGRLRLSDDGIDGFAADDFQLILEIESDAFVPGAFAFAVRRLPTGQYLVVHHVGRPDGKDGQRIFEPSEVGELHQFVRDEMTFAFRQMSPVAKNSIVHEHGREDLSDIRLGIPSDPAVDVFKEMKWYQKVVEALCDRIQARLPPVDPAQ